MAMALMVGSLVMWAVMVLRLTWVNGAFGDMLVSCCMLLVPATAVLSILTACIFNMAENSSS